MKKIIITLLLMSFLLCVYASASDGLLISPSPNAEQTEEQKLLQSLYNGIIPITPDTTYDDMMSYISIIDESQNKMYTNKLATFFEIIPYYHYSSLSKDEVFEMFVNTVDSININDMDATYRTLFSMLDKFSYYLTPEQAKDFLTPTANKGAGIEMMWREATDDFPCGIYITEIAKNSPAQKAGMETGDRIVEYNGYNLRGLGFEALSAYLASADPDAETVSFTLSRKVNGEFVETSYTVEKAENLFSEYQIKLYPEKNLVYLDIDSFMYKSTATEICSDLDAAWTYGYTNIIIDLQNNSGGDVYVTASILRKFINTTAIMFSMGRDGNKFAVPFISDSSGHKFDSVSILVNEKTASSAEIFARTLDRLADATLIGTNTFGKGVAQTMLSFEDGAACGVTTYVAYDSEGKTYNEVGLVPDARVTGTFEKNTLPDKTPCFTALNYTSATSGANNSTVLGLEIRLNALGFLSDEEVDTLWSDATSRALSALKLSLGLEPDEQLDKETYKAIVTLIKNYENSYKYTFTPFDYAYRFIKK